MSTTQAAPAPPRVDEPVDAGRLSRLRSRRRNAGKSTRLAPMSPTRAAIVATLATVTALAVWFVLYALVFSGLQEGHTQHVLYTRLRSYLAQQKVPFGGVITPGTPVALITAPSIHLRSVVVEGTSSKDLAKGPGHYPSSPFPGQAGVSVIFGRSATFGGPFARIDALHRGAPIVVTTGQGRSVFRVEDVRRAGDPLPPVLPANSSGLTLATSAGSGWRSGWAPTQVVYVDASLATGKVFPAPPGRPTAVASSDRPLASDSDELIILVLWLQALVLVAAGLVYARNRLTGWQMWLVGLPCVIAALWGAAGAALILLPNLA